MEPGSSFTICMILGQAVKPFVAQFPEPQSGNDSTNPIGLPWGVKSDNCITHIDHIVSAQWIITVVVVEVVSVMMIIFIKL